MTMIVPLTKFLDLMMLLGELQELYHHDAIINQVSARVWPDGTCRLYLGVYSAVGEDPETGILTVGQAIARLGELIEERKRERRLKSIKDFTLAIGLVRDPDAVMPDNVIEFERVQEGPTNA
jgi:hypothetical protein